MLLIRLWNFLRGYVIISVEGYFTERFINICTRRQLFLWDVIRLSDTTITLKMSIKGFKMLRPIAKKTRSKVRIVSKNGMPFVISRYKKRKAFMLGALLFIVLINLVASFVWDIEVTGNKEVGRSEIISELDNLGIRTGTLKYKADPNKIANELILKIDKLAWVGFEIKGTRVLVTVKERIMPPELIPKDIPCDIIAKRDAIISSIVVKDGHGLVKNGDTVLKGQTLVTGVIENKNEGEAPRLVHSLADIEARTWYEGSSTVKLKIMEPIRTGRVKNSYIIKIFGKEIKLPFSSKIEFENYDKVELRNVMKIGDDFILPFELLTDKYFENKMVERRLSIDEAKEIAYNDALKRLMDIIPEDAKIINKTVDYKADGQNSMTANIIIECLEDIGVTKEIGGY